MNAIPSWLTYDTGGAVRNQPLSPEMIAALSFLPELGLTARVFSAGQPSSGPNRVGSHRHDGGMSGDMFFYKDGRQLSYSNPDDLPLLQAVVKMGKQRGLTGFGAGEGYMQPGSMHVGFGNPAVWGAGGKGANAPEWLKQAYYGTASPQNPLTFGAKGPAPTQTDRNPFKFGGTISPGDEGIWALLSSQAGQDMAEAMTQQQAPAPQVLQAPVAPPQKPMNRSTAAAYRRLFERVRRA